MKISLKRFRRRVAGTARVVMLLSVALAIAVVLSAKAAMARADDAMMDLGRHLLALSEAGLGRGSRGVIINGQQLGLRVFSTEHDMETILDFYDGWCRGGLGSFATQEEQLFLVDESISQIAPADDRSWRDMTMRDAQGDFGFVGCIKHGVPGATNSDLGTRMMRFFESGNLRELGQFHYAAVTRVNGVSRVVAVWTEGDFYPGEMFPKEGDAPGFDAAGVSRPPSGQRMLSAGEIGFSETLTIYVDTNESVPELAQFYRRDFLSRGWRVLADEMETRLHYFIVQRGSEMRVVSISQQNGEKPSVTIATTN